MTNQKRATAFLAVLVLLHASPSAEAQANETRAIAPAASINSATARNAPDIRPRETSLSIATDLTRDARESAARRIPIVILYSLPGCAHCEILRRSHLAPLAAQKPARAIVRQINLQSTVPLRDFAGNATTHANFVKVRAVSFAPIVQVLDHTGKLIADPLVGSMLADFYGAYLEDALQKAEAAVR
jgi:hypothetical protein